MPAKSLQAFLVRTPTGISNGGDDVSDGVGESDGAGVSDGVGESDGAGVSDRAIVFDEADEWVLCSDSRSSFQINHGKKIQKVLSLISYFTRYWYLSYKNCARHRLCTV